MTAVMMTVGACGVSSDTVNDRDAVADGGLATVAIDCDGADPWIIQERGEYYYTKVVDDEVLVLRSPHLGDIASGESIVAFGGGQGIEAYWAPEIHHLDGAWYIYFAAQPVGDDIHRMYVLENTAVDPFDGEWTLREMQGMDDKFAIDGTVVDTGTGRYFIWSGWDGYENVRQDLYIARMESPVKVRNEKVLISQPEYEWERHGDPKVNEGPAAIVRDGTVNLAYSASGSWTNDYCIGLLTADTDADLTDPTAWTKHGQPILSGGNGVIAPGHNSFVTTPDGSQTLMVYHVARWKDGGWNRAVRYQPVIFDEQGMLEPMEPTEPARLQAAPSGEPARIRLQAADAALSEGVELVNDAGSVAGRAVAGLEERSRTASWTFDVAQSGTYTIFAYVRMEQVYDENEVASVGIMVDGDPGDGDEPLRPSSDYQPVGVRRHLDAGRHDLTIACDSIANPLRLDRVELMPV